MASVHVRPDVDPSLEPLATEHAEYVELCKRAAVTASEAGFAAAEKMDAVRRAGVDKDGRDVYMFFPGNLPESVDLDNVTLYALWLMHDAVVRQGRPYTAVWVCNNMLDSRLSFWWFRSVYKMLPRAYKKQMRCVCVVRPSIQVRLLLFLLSYVVKTDFWDKLVYADRIEFLDEVLKDETIATLPEEYKEYDKALDKAMYSAMEDPALKQLSGMYGVPGPAFSPQNGLDPGFDAGEPGLAAGRRG